MIINKVVYYDFENWLWWLLLNKLNTQYNYGN